MGNEIVIFGAGGHAKVVADIVIKAGQYKITAFVDDYKDNQQLWNIPIISEKTYFANPTIAMGVVALGDNYIREKVVKLITEKNSKFIFIKAIHPSAQIASDTTIGVGTVVMANAVVNPSSAVGAHCIVNTAASVDHDCLIHDFASIAPGACLGGNCQVGRSSAVSVGATLLHKITIGTNSVVGAGSIVTKNVPENCVSFGSPSKVVRSRKSGDKYL